MRVRHVVCTFLLLFGQARFQPGAAQVENMTRLEREERQAILSTVYEDIRKEYYDPKFHGLDWSAQYAQAKEKVARAETKVEANLQIAGMLEGLNDSHTHFIPPPRSVREDYGLDYLMVGDGCFIIHVKPGSDAEAKGLKRGDQILTINGFTPERNSLPKLKYLFNVLYPQTGLRFDVRDPAGQVRKVDVMAKEKEIPRILTGVDRWRASLDSQENRRQSQPVTVEFSDQLVILRLSNFMMSDFAADALADTARRHEVFIVDLRGNPGGSVETLRRFLGDLFADDVKVGDEVKREKTTPVMTKGRHGSAYHGKLYVLVDSKSASAAEIFSRVIQLEKRGTVFGDVTSGSVMAARVLPHHYGTHEVLVYGVEVSIADFLMSDGKSLEHVGVVPDQRMLPTQQDLAAGRDPVLAAVAAKAGVNLTAEKAAELFPIEWPRD